MNSCYLGISLGKIVLSNSCPPRFGTKRAKTEAHRQTVENAKVFNQRASTTPDDIQNAQNEKNAKRQKFLNKLFADSDGVFFPGTYAFMSVFSGLLAFVAIAPSPSTIPTTNQISPARQNMIEALPGQAPSENVIPTEQRHSSPYAKLFFFVCLTGLTLSSIFTIEHVSESFNEMSAARKKLKALINNNIRFVPPETPEEKILLKLLENQMYEDAGQFVQKLAEFYEKDPMSHPWFDQVFGVKESLSAEEIESRRAQALPCLPSRPLPSTEEIQNLFLYYAYLQYRSEHGPAKMNQYPRLELVKNACHLMKTSREMGDLFNLVEPDRRSEFGQKFARNFLAPSAANQSQLNRIRHLHEKTVTLQAQIQQLEHLLLTIDTATIQNDSSQSEKHTQLVTLLKKLQEQHHAFQSLKVQDVTSPPSETSPKNYPVQDLLANLSESALPGHTAIRNPETVALCDRLERMIEDTASSLVHRLFNRDDAESTRAIEAHFPNKRPDKESLKRFFLWQSSQALKVEQPAFFKKPLDRLAWLKRTYVLMQATQETGGLMSLLNTAARVPEASPYLGLIARESRYVEVELEAWINDYLQWFKAKDQIALQVEEARDQLVMAGLSPSGELEHQALQTKINDLTAETIQLQKLLSESTPKHQPSEDVKKERNRMMESAMAAIQAFTLENEIELKAESLVAGILPDEKPLSLQTTGSEYLNLQLKPERQANAV